RLDHGAHAVSAQRLGVEVDAEEAAVLHLGAGAPGGVADAGGAGARLAQVDHRLARLAGAPPQRELIVDLVLARVDLGEVDAHAALDRLAPAGAAVGHVAVAAAGHAPGAGLDAAPLGGGVVGGVGVVVHPLVSVRVEHAAVVLAEL